MTDEKKIDWNHWLDEISAENLKRKRVEMYKPPVRTSGPSVHASPATIEEYREFVRKHRTPLLPPPKTFHMDLEEVQKQQASEIARHRMATMKSGNHQEAVKQEDGTWICKKCQAESADFEIFEEAGDYEKCKTDVGNGVGSGAGSKEALGQVQRITEELKNAHGATVRTTEAFEDMSDAMKEMIDAMRRGKI